MPVSASWVGTTRVVRQEAPHAGRHRAAAIFTLVETCKLNTVDPCAWLADVFVRIAAMPTSGIDDPLVWK